MPRTTLPATRALTKCPEWPTSHTLPHVVVARLERAMWRLRGTSRPARRQDVLAIAIMYFAPVEPSALMVTMTTPHRALKGTAAQLPTGRYRRTLVESNEQLMVWLPSPVTLRLNALVDQLHMEGFRATRRQVVTAIVLHCLPDKASVLAAAFDRYLGAPASAARVAGRPLREVLSLDRPLPGRRPMP